MLYEAMIVDDVDSGNRGGSVDSRQLDDYDLNMPPNFMVGLTGRSGDSFLEAFRQGLEQLREERVAVDDLRKYCKEFAENNPPEWFRNNISDSFDNCGLKRTEGSCRRGNAEIDGRILCMKYRVKLHITDQQNVNDNHIVMDQIIDYEGASCVSNVNYNDENTIHIVNTGNTNFRLVLDKSKSLEIVEEFLSMTDNLQTLKSAHEQLKFQNKKILYLGTLIKIQEVKQTYDSGKRLKLQNVFSIMEENIFLTATFDNNDNNLMNDTNFLILSCKHHQLEHLSYLFNKQKLLENVYSSYVRPPIKIDDIDDFIKSCREKDLSSSKDSYIARFIAQNIVLLKDVKVTGFEPLYADCGLLEDTDGIKNIISYLELALSANPEEQSGRLVIERAVYVIGEFINGPPMSPNLTDDRKPTLLQVQVASIIKHLPSLRNLLSYNILQRFLSKYGNENETYIFTHIKTDLRKFDTLFTQIRHDFKMNSYEILCKRIIKSDKNNVEKLSDEFVRKVELENPKFWYSGPKRAVDQIEKFIDTIKQVKSENKNFCVQQYSANLEINNIDQFLLEMQKIVNTVKERIPLVNSQNARRENIADIINIIKIISNKQDININAIKYFYSSILIMITRSQHIKIQNPFELMSFVEDILENSKSQHGYSEIIYLITMIRDILFSEMIRNTVIDALEIGLNTINSSTQEDLLKGELSHILSTFKGQVSDKEKYNELESVLKHRKQIHWAKLELMAYFEGNKKLTKVEYRVIVKKLYDAGVYFDCHIKELIRELQDCFWKLSIGKNKLNINDTYEDCNKALSNKEYNIDAILRSFNLFAETLNLEDNSTEIVKSIFKKKIIEFEHYFSEKLNFLNKRLNIITTSRGQLKSEYRNDTALQAEVEMLLLHIRNFLISDSIFHLSLGKHLTLSITTSLKENYERGNVSIQYLTLDPFEAVIANALILAKEGESIFALRKLLSDPEMEKFLRKYDQKKQDLPPELKHHSTNFSVFKQSDRSEYYLKNTFGNIEKTDCQRLIYDSNLKIIADQKSLFQAITSDNVDECNKDGADVTGRDSNENTAALNGRSDVVKVLISTGADISARNTNGNTALHIASEKGCKKTFDILLHHRANIKSENSEGDLPLHYAAMGGNVGIFNRISQDRANNDVTCRNGLTPLHDAVRKQSTGAQVIKYLVKRGANVNSRDAQRRTPLCLAAEWGNDSAVNTLMEINADVDLSDNKGLTPLHAAAINGHAKVVESILKMTRRVDVNAKSKDKGYTPLHFAALGAHNEVIKLLIKQANIKDNYNNTPLHLYTGTLEGVRYLVELGQSNIHACDKSGRAPLHFAVRHNNLEVVKYLVKQGAKVNAGDTNGNIPLHSWVCHKYGDINILKFLVDKGSDLNTANKYKTTLLHRVAYAGNLTALKYLLDKKAQVDFRDINGMTALHFATFNGSSDAIRFLVSKDADVTAKDNFSCTPLHYAVLLGYCQLIEVLLSEGAVIDAVDANGNTSLHLAAEIGHVTALRTLLAVIKDVHIVNIPNNSGQTPLHIAAGKGHENCVKVLLGKRPTVLKIRGVTTALHLAAKYDYLGVDNIFVLKNDNVNILDKRGMTPLLCAARFGHKHVVKTLLNHKANVNIADDCKNTPLYYAAYNGHQNVVETILKYVDDNCPDQLNKAMNAVNINKATPLDAAASGCHHDVIDHLLSRNAEMNAVDGEGRAPLHLAAEKGCMKCRSILLKINIRKIECDRSLDC